MYNKLKLGDLKKENPEIFDIDNILNKEIANYWINYD